MNKMVNKEEVISVYNTFTKEEMKMMHADAILEGSKVPAWAEDQYAGGALCSPLQDIWERFEKSEDFDVNDYIYVYTVIEELYFKGIKEVVFNSMDYETTKTYLKRSESLIKTINECSLHYLLDDNDDKEYLEMYDKLLDTFKIAPLAYKDVELYWLHKICDILLENLYQNWFNDFMTSGYLSQTIFIKPVHEGLKSIGIDISTNELSDNWECYRKIIKHIVPKDKQHQFSKACREEFRHYSCSSYYSI